MVAAVLDSVNEIEVDEAEEFASVGSFNHGYLMVLLKSLDFILS